jgi:uncharacterized membrane protein YqjE
METNRPGNGHSLGEILGGLAGDVQDLVKGEITLARAELEQKLHRLLGALLWVIGGALVAFAGLVVLLQGGAAALALHMPAWAALAIVGVVIVIVGAALARLGLGMLTLKTLAPERTAANLQKDSRMMKEHTT